MLYMIIEHFRDGDPLPVYRRLRDEGRLAPEGLRYVASWVTEDFPLHVIVENQVVLGDEIPVRRTLERLRAEGLDRHDAVHAVGSVVAKRIYELLKEGLPAGDPNEPYWAELESLNAEGWRHGG